jgi:hypothetical protein
MPPKMTVAPRALDRSADFIAAQCISGVDPDADDVAGLDRFEIERLERLVDDAWRSVRGGVAAPRTNSQRGVMTPTPKDRWLGLTRWTVIGPVGRTEGTVAWNTRGSKTQHSTSSRSCAAA